MLLISAVRAANAMGMSCTPETAVANDPLLEMLRLMTPRAAGFMNVNDLARKTTIDHFNLPTAPTGEPVMLRLSNAIVTGAPTFLGLQEEPEFGMNPDTGMLQIDRYAPVAGQKFFVSYTSGFAVPPDPAPGDTVVHADANYRVAIGVPEWLEGAVVDCLVHWQRNNLQAPKVGKEYGFLPTLNAAVMRDLQSRIYSSYMRPRANCLWATGLTY